MEFIQQYKPWLDEKESTAVLEYMQGGGYLTEFKKTQDFAQSLAEYTQSPFCSICSNGTVTLIAALIALGIINKEDEVIVPDYTMVVTANSVIMAGATPIFADVERETICLDFESMKTKVTPRTKAIMLVSINGRYPTKIDEIVAYCKENKIFIVEDAAQSLGCWYKGKHVGTYGDIGSFSFSMPKIITTGQGGALITSNPEWHRKIELIKNFGRESAGIDKHIFYGVNFKFTDLQAVIGIEQMKKLPLRVELKKKNYRLFKDLLKDVKEIEFINTTDDVAPWFNDIIVPEVAPLQDYLKKNGIGSRNFYPVLHTQAPYHQTDKYSPNADFFSNHGLWLPSYTQLTEEEIKYITNTIINFYQK
ncbi:MAG: DegT/DnrJ/EryC1/StrS family aminotransferase [Bacteroidetes bacterium]|nr:MAG: DegT/DnrJ/EryC1/StrS family aminotransferase [Bacteroidota bacterium]TAG90494.1 MAG: DegT/DnrJ/EryC1/StrS family aminotransferase [Bacteroidota bacterium]